MCCLRALALLVASVYIKLKEDNSSVKLFCCDGILDKNHRLVEPPRHIEIQSLCQYVPQDVPKRPMCPVQAFECYLKNTQQVWGDRICMRVFVLHIKNFSGDISFQTVARDIKLAFTLCDQRQKLGTECHASAHKGQAMAMSTRLGLTNSVDSLFKAANWKSYNTCASF